MAAKKLQVFISSTYTDMLQERQAAVEAVLTAGHIPAGMELFSAGDRAQWDTIRRWIDDSDVFMLILGGRYGSLEPTSGKSYIQLEYEYAIEKKKPFFAVVISDAYLEAKTKANGTKVVETENGKLLKAFREMVTKRMCRFFNEPKDVKLAILESLPGIASLEEVVGWVRGDEAIYAKVTLEKLSRLEVENKSLLSMIDDMRSRITLREAFRADRLSERAKQLLVSAYKSKEFIKCKESSLMLKVDGKDVLKGQRTFEEFWLWADAIRELVENKCIVSVNAGRISPFEAGVRGYELSHVGYRVADELVHRANAKAPQGK